MFDDVIVVYKFLGDLMFFVTGSQDENELILYQVLLGFYEAISILLRYQLCFFKPPPSFIHTVSAQDTTLLSSMSCKSCHDRASAGSTCAGFLKTGRRLLHRCDKSQTGAIVKHVKLDTARNLPLNHQMCPLAGMLWRRRLCWRTWIWCCLSWTRQWMAGKQAVPKKRIPFSPAPVLRFSLVSSDCHAPTCEMRLCR